MPPDDDRERRELYGEYRRELFARQLSNSENLDRSVLSLSSAGLGLSMAFIKDIIHLGAASHMAVLKTSWAFFTLAIVATLVSFIASQLGIGRQLVYAEEYFVDGDEAAREKKNLYATWTVRLSFAAVAFFVVAILLTVWFTAANV